MALGGIAHFRIICEMAWMLSTGNRKIAGYRPAAFL
jgi:hypothetical protein